MGKLSSKSIKILKTSNLYLCFFFLGLCIAVPGPCLLDLMHLVNTTIEQITFIYTARSLGYLLGSMLGGILLDFVKSKQIILTICNFLASASMLGIPWSQNLPILTGFMIINGISLGVIEIGGNIVCLTLWESDSGPYYQALFFTFGVGAIAAPIIAAPFLGHYTEGSDSATENNITLSNYTSDFSSNNTDYFNINSTDDSSSRMIYPFSMIGAFGLLVTLIFVGVCVISPTEPKRSGNEDSKDGKRSLSFLLTLVILNFLLLFVEAGTEFGYAQMLTTYVVKGRLQLPTSVGSYMTSTFWTAFTFSRLVSIFLAIKISSFMILLNDLILILIGSLVLMILASYEWAIWLASVLLGLGIASFYPAAIGWLDTYVNVNNRMASVFVVGASCGEMVVPFTINYYIDTVPDVLIYVVTASSVSSALVFFILYMILRKRQKKCIKKEPEVFVIDRPTTNT